LDGSNVIFFSNITIGARKSGSLFLRQWTILDISVAIVTAIAIAIAVPAVLYRGVHVNIDVSIATAVAIPVASYRSVPV
jgi:hypothetical protein